jgi:hypothetical protein
VEMFVCVCVCVWCLLRNTVMSIKADKFFLSAKVRKKFEKYMDQV